MKYWSWLLISLIIVVAFSGCTDNKEWTLSAIEKRIGTQLPSSATNIRTDVQDAPGDELIYLEFDLPLYEGDSFARRFCSGHLEPSVNPFKQGAWWNKETNTFIPYHSISNLEFGLSCDTYPVTRLLVDRRNRVVDHVALQVWFP